MLQRQRQFILNRLLPMLLLALVMTSTNVFAENSRMKIMITINGNQHITASLNNSIAARDFFDLLPLELTLRDFAGTEKASGDLPKKLRTTDSPSGHKPKAGQLTHYAPWNNLAIFYKDDKYANGLVLLGEIDNESEAFNLKGNVKISIKAQ